MRATARAAARAGAEIINDVSGLTWDAVMADVVAQSGCGLVLMHARGRSGEWQTQPGLDSDAVVPVVFAGLCEQLVQAEAVGIRTERIVVDPGFGFGKRGAENFALLARLGRLRELGRPLLVGLSRKGFLGEAVKPLQRKNVDLAEARRIATVAANVTAILAGAHVLRVHDLQVAQEAAAVADAVLQRMSLRATRAELQPCLSLQIVSTSFSLARKSSSMRLISAIGELLDLGVGTLFVVGGDQLVLGGLLHRFVAFAADVADRGLVVFDRAGQQLDRVLAALFGHGRDGHADDLAVVHGVETVLAGADGLFDGRDQALLPGLNQNQVRFGGGDLRNLRNWSLGTIVVNRIPSSMWTDARPVRTLTRFARKSSTELVHARLKSVIYARKALHPCHCRCHGVYNLLNDCRMLRLQPLILQPDLLALLMHPKGVRL